MARGLGYGVRVDKGSVTLRVASKSQSRNVRERLVGANARATLAAEQLLPGKLNLLIGNDRSAWRTGLATYGKVHVKSAYPGIDVVYYGKGRRVQADYVVAPGADPNKIRLAFDGISGAKVNSRGDLSLSVGAGNLVKTKPVAYQMVGSRRVPVTATYRVASSAGVPVASFELGSYDRSRTLVIDPILDWSGFFGGTDEDYIQGLTNNSDGFLYLVGGTASSVFLTTDGAVDRSYNGGLFDVFVTKVRSNGSTVEYSTLLGGAGTDQPSSIAVASDMVTLCGDTDSADWPVTPGCFQSTNGGGGADGFVATLNSTGTGLVGSTYLGGANYDSPKALALQNGSVYVTGYTQSSNFPAVGAYQSTLGTAAAAAFLTKLNGTLTAASYSTYLRGTDTAPNVSRSTQAFGVAVDASEQATVVGRTNHTTFPRSIGALQTTLGGSFDGFVTKFSALGSTLIFSTYLGGNGHDTLNAVKQTANGDYVVAGTTESTNLAVTSGALQSTTGGGDSDGLVARLASDGETLVWCTYLGGSGADQINALGVDRNDSVYVAGDTTSTNLPVSSNAIRSTISGTQDAFLAKIGGTGRALLFGTYLGGLGDDSAVALGESTGGDTVYVAGWTTGSAFLPATPLWTVQAASGGGLSDGFVMKVSPPNLAPSVSGVNRSATRGVSVSLTGYFWHNAAGVAGKTLRFTLDGTSVGSGTTAASGRVDLSYSVPVGATLGAHPYTVLFNGDESYIAASGAATLTIVTSHATTLVADDKTATYGATVTLQATLSDYLAAPLAGKTIAFKIDGTSVGSGVTGATGVAQCDYAVTALPGSRTILAEFAAEGLNAASSDTATLTVNHIATSTFATANSARTGTTTPLRALLRTVAGSTPLSGKSVSFKVGATTVGSATTGADGWASYSYAITDAAGSYTIRADFAGDATYGSSYGEASWTVLPALRATTLVTADKTASLNSSVVLQATLTDNISGALGGKVVAFKVDGTAVGSSVTAATGGASLSYAVSGSSGSRTILAEYAAEGNYLGCSDTATLTVNKIATTTFATAISARTGTTSPLTALLRTSAALTALSGKSVSFKVGATTVGSATTGGDGWASYSYAITDAAGTYTIRADFAGDTTYGASFGEASWTVLPALRATTLVTADKTASLGATVALQATLTDNISGALGGKVLAFKIDGTAVGTAVTAATGVASLSYAVSGSAGARTILAEYAAEGNYLGCSDTATLTVNTIATTTFVTASTGVAGTTSTLRGLLRTSALVALAGKTITFKVSGTEVGTGTTGADGWASYLLSLGVRPHGSYPVRADFAGDTTYTASYHEGTMAVIQHNTMVTVSSAAAYYGTSAVLSAKLLLIPGGAAISGKTITFKVDGSIVGSGTTGADGWASYTMALAGVTSGAHTLQAVYAGELAYAGSDGSSTLTVNKYTTTVFATARSGNRGGSSVLSALLRTSGVPLSGKTISFKVDGTVVGSGTTAAPGATVGWATYDYSLVGATVGSHTVVAEFAGDDAYASSNGSSTMAVGKESTILYTSAASVVRLAQVYLRGYLRDSANVWLADKSISFSIGGTWVGNATTNSSGVASYLYTATVAAGPHTILATFAGDASYAGDTDTDTLTVTP
ncbi:MAG: Ig-like domain repeat protein [Armatimonadetes bacterium]|nr:Ig-like domain repeat protein [Armatimonadota bacterium]